MHMLRTAVGLLVSAVIVAGCVSGSPEPGEHVGRVTLPIINGTPDTTHPAVVALLSNQSECSGTIFLVNGPVGYVLTAAHCCTPADHPLVAIQGADYNAQSAIQYDVSDYKADPNYDQQYHDYCVVKIAGTSPSTPAIPLMTKANDNLQIGDTVDFVGFGVTKGDDPSNMNTVRLHVSGPLNGVEPYVLQYDQSKGGPCSGDSGGPSISVVNGQEFVSGVTSYGDQACVQYGVSGRVSADYDDFIMAYVSGQPIGQDCDGCGTEATSGQGACVPETNACFSDADCKALVTCLDNCQNDVCSQSCFSAHVSGTVLYQKVNACVCQTACVTECVSECSGSSTTSTSTTTGSGGAGTSGTNSTGTVNSGNSGSGGDDAPPRSTSVTTGGCSTAPSPGSGPLGGALALGIAGLGMVVRRRRRL